MASPAARSPDALLSAAAARALNLEGEGAEVAAANTAAEAEVEAARAKVGAAQADVDTAQADVDAAQAQVDAAQAELSDMQAELAKAARQRPQVELVQLSDLALTAERKLWAAKDRLSVAERGLSVAERGLSTAKDRLSTAKERLLAGLLQQSLDSARGSQVPMHSYGSATVALPPFAASKIFDRIRARVQTVESPSKMKTGFMPTYGGRFVRRPLHLKDDVESSVGDAIDALLIAADACKGDSINYRALLVEGNLYRAAMQVVPDFAEAVSESPGIFSAEALFGTESLKTRYWSFPGNCVPDLHVRGKVPEGAHGGSVLAGFNGELKSVGQTALDQAVVYTLMDMVRIYFPALQVDGEWKHRDHRYYNQPPVGYALICFAHVAYCLAIEWIGVPFVSIVSQPFFLGSAEHQQAVKALPRVKYTNVDLGVTGWQSPSIPEMLTESTVQTQSKNPLNQASREVVLWNVTDTCFRKLLPLQAFGDEKTYATQATVVFERVYRVYSQLESALQSAGRPSSLPSFARLLYGAGELLIEMEAILGRDATDEEVFDLGGPTQAAAAEAVAWLASTCNLLYIDLRGPNVRVNDDTTRVCLVDFDDCIVLDHPIHSAAAYYQEMLRHCPPGIAVQTFADHIVNKTSRGQRILGALDEAFQVIGRARS